MATTQSLKLLAMQHPRLLERVGSIIGAPVIVWCAEDGILCTGTYGTTNVPVVMKIYRSTAIDSSCFTKSVITSVQHPHVLRCFAMGSLDVDSISLCYAVMEQCVARDVEYLQFQTRFCPTLQFTAREVTQLCIDVSLAIQRLHAYGVVGMGIAADRIFLVPSPPALVASRGRWVYKLSIVPHHPGIMGAHPSMDGTQRLLDIVRLFLFSRSIGQPAVQNQDTAVKRTAAEDASTRLHVMRIKQADPASPNFYQTARGVFRDAPATLRATPHIGPRPLCLWPIRTTADIALRAFQYWITTVHPTDYTWTLQPDLPPRDSCLWWDFRTCLVHFGVAQNAAWLGTRAGELKEYMTGADGRVTITSYLSAVAWIGEFYNPIRAPAVYRNLSAMVTAPWFHSPTGTPVLDSKCIVVGVQRRSAEGMLTDLATKRNTPCSTVWDCPFTMWINKSTKELTDNTASSSLSGHIVINVARMPTGHLRVKLDTGGCITCPSLPELVMEIETTLSRRKQQHQNIQAQ